MATSTAISPSDLAQAIMTSWEQRLLMGRSVPMKRPYVYASSRRECTRRMVLEMTDGDKMTPFEPDVLAKFERGQDRERDLLISLTRAGQTCEPSFTVIGQQERFELRDHQGRVAIVGKVDARLQVNGDRPPVEVKSWSPQLVDRINRFEDLFESPWTRSGAYQLLSYLFAAGESFGFLLLDRSGLPLLLPVELIPNLDRVEEFLGQAETAMDHKAAGTLPDYIQDAGECKRCPFFGAGCNPPLLSGEGAVVLTDPELEPMLERWESLKDSALEYDRIDSDIKKKLRGVEMGICGKFAVTGKWGKQTKYEYPEDIKKQYARVDPKGRFTLEITKL
jgi:hypothetical protein